MTKKELAIKDLRTKVSGLLSRPTSDKEFVAYLSIYAKRGHEILYTRTDAETKPEVSRQWREWANDQKVVDFCHEHKLILDKTTVWWWIRDQHTGTINGLEKTVQGIERITNGIIVYIELQDGTLFKGHRDWWKPHKEPKPKKEKKPEWEPNALDLLMIELMSK